MYYRVAKTHRCLIFMGYFPQKSRMINGSFAKNDLQLKTSAGSSPPCIMCVYPHAHTQTYMTNSYRKYEWVMTHISMCSQKYVLLIVFILTHTHKHLWKTGIAQVWMRCDTHIYVLTEICTVTCVYPHTHTQTYVIIQAHHKYECLTHRVLTHTFMCSLKSVLLHVYILAHTH